MAAKYDGIERYVFSDAYLFFLKYKDIPNEDYYWNCLINDASILYFKYKNHPFAKSIVMDTLSQLEHKVNNTVLAGFTHEQWEQVLEVAKKTPFK